MDALIGVVNIAACVAFALLASWAVLSPEVQDGVIIKLGLILVALGFGATGAALALYEGEHESLALGRSLFLVHAGIVVILAGYAMRTRRGRRKKRRATDWMSLDGAAPAESPRSAWRD